MSEKTELAIPSRNHSNVLSVFSPEIFDHSQRVGKMFAESQMVPTAFQKNLPNVLIAMEISNRIGASHLAVMQSLNIIHGKPSWSAQFIIAAINSSGRFSALRFVYANQGSDAWSCFARATALSDKEELKGATVTIEMAKKEGWYGKSGSKWQTMPELMLMYRAATFWGRMFAPDILMGMSTEDEVIDIRAAESVVDSTPLVFSEGDQAPVKKRAGVRGMKLVDPAATATAQAESPAPTAPTPVIEAVQVYKSVPEQAATAPEQATAPEEEQEQPGVAPLKTPAPAVPSPSPRQSTIRAEIVSAVEVAATTSTGKAVKIELRGTDFTGVAYYDGPFIKVPGNTSIADLVLERKESTQKPGTFVNVIKDINAIG